MEDFVPHLRKCDLFAGMPDSMLRMLHPGCLWVWLKADEALFHEGAPGGALYIVCAGELAVERKWRRDEDTEEVVFLAHRNPYEVIGELSLFDDARRAASVRATVDKTRLLMVDGRYVNQCLEGSHAFALNLLKAVSRKLVESISRRAEREASPIPNRLANVLLELMDAQGVPQPDGSVVIRGRVTQTDLGHRVGCSREVVCKHLKEFGPGLVESNRGSIRVRRRKRIEAIASRPY